MFRSLFRFGIGSITWILLIVTPLFGQSRSQVADSLKKVIADHRQEVFAADSSGDVLLGIELRSQLATLVKPKEARQLLEAAAALADSADLIDAEASLRERLGEEYAQVGDHRRAYEQAKRVVVLDQLRLAVQGRTASDQAENLMADARAERDSLEQRWHKELQESRYRESHMEATAERWFFIALGIGAAWALSVVFFLVSLRRQRDRTRAEIEALRAEITAIKEAPRNRFREPVPAVELSPPPVEAEPPGPPIGPPVAMDATALAFFQRMAPERLTALQAARAQGDQDKVMRVVHTLKPHLEALDPQGLGALCVRLRSMDPKQEQGAWETGLDQLAGGVQTLLSQA